MRGSTDRRPRGRTHRRRRASLRAWRRAGRLTRSRSRAAVVCQVADLQRRRALTAAKARWELQRSADAAYDTVESFPTASLNAVVRAMWPNYLEQYVAGIAKEKISAKLRRTIASGKMPPYISDFEIEELTFGTVPPTAEYGRARLSGQKSYLVAHLAFLHDPQLELGVTWTLCSCHAVLAVHLKPTALIPAFTARLEVYDLSIDGKICLGFRLADRYPGTVGFDFSFAERPALDVNIRPLGFSLAQFPGLATWLNDLLINGIARVVVEPKRTGFSIERLYLRRRARRHGGLGGLLVVTILAARDLPEQAAATDTGTSASQVVHFMGHVQRTSACRNTANPEWNKMLEYPLPAGFFKTAGMPLLATSPRRPACTSSGLKHPQLCGCRIRIQCLDWETLGEKVLLGWCEIPLDSDSISVGQPMDAWLPLLGRHQGAVHVRVVVLPPHLPSSTRAGVVEAPDAVPSPSENIASRPTSWPPQVVIPNGEVAIEPLKEDAIQPVSGGDLSSSIHIASGPGSSRPMAEKPSESGTSQAVVKQLPGNASKPPVAHTSPGKERHYGGGEDEKERRRERKASERSTASLGWRGHEEKKWRLIEKQYSECAAVPFTSSSASSEKLIAPQVNALEGRIQQMLECHPYHDIGNTPLDREVLPTSGTSKTTCESPSTQQAAGGVEDAISSGPKVDDASEFDAAKMGALPGGESREREENTTTGRDHLQNQLQLAELQGRLQKEASKRKLAEGQQVSLLSQLQDLNKEREEEHLATLVSGAMFLLHNQDGCELRRLWCSSSLELLLWGPPGAWARKGSSSFSKVGKVSSSVKVATLSRVVAGSAEFFRPMSVSSQRGTILPSMKKLLAAALDPNRCLSIHFGPSHATTLQLSLEVPSEGNGRTQADWVAVFSSLLNHSGAAAQG
eukprot:SM000099S25218  [mRNA]  locus=s99:265934:271678:- [translate_table: standard]